jgi:hypothetical protein
MVIQIDLSCFAVAGKESAIRAGKLFPGLCAGDCSPIRDLCHFFTQIAPVSSQTTIQLRRVFRPHSTRLTPP